MTKLLLHLSICLFLFGSTLHNSVAAGRSFKEAFEWQQQPAQQRQLTGVIVSQQEELIPNVTIIARTASDEQRVMSDAEGRFSLVLTNEEVTVRFEGKNLNPIEQVIKPGEPTYNLRIRMTYIIPPISESVVIQDTSLNPAIDRRNDSVYKNSLFQRDDQLVETLDRKSVV